MEEEIAKGTVQYIIRETRKNEIFHVSHSKKSGGGLGECGGDNLEKVTPAYRTKRRNIGDQKRG